MLESNDKSTIHLKMMSQVVKTWYETASQVLYNLINRQNRSINSSNVSSVENHGNQTTGHYIAFVIHLLW